MCVTDCECDMSVSQTLTILRRTKLVMYKSGSRKCIIDVARMWLKVRPTSLAAEFSQRGSGAKPHLGVGLVATETRQAELQYQIYAAENSLT